MYIYKARKFVHIKFTRRYTVHPERLNDFPSCYNASDTEQGWYEVWEKNKFFQPQNTNEIYRMILPPPNVTGTLHLGHALTVTVQDILARWYRMKGFPVIWVPGFDHAGIATQAVVEKYLSKTKNIKRNSLTRTEFHTIVNDWKNNKSKKIKNQLKELGASVDWSREYFTMDEHHSKAVKEAFVILNKRQLLYRDKSLVNWSSALGSTLSDIELEFETVTGKVDLSVSGYNNKVTFGQIYEISYDLINSDDKLSVATTRPETLPGDVALAVHPDDERYSQFIGQLVWHPLKKTSLPVIADENVKRDFGTGIVKITPAHDKLDFNIAKKHGLKMIEVINEDGKLTKEAGRFQGLPRFIARENILTELVNLNALKSVKDHPMLIPRCSRTGDIIEQLLREQWFISCKNMASRAFEAVKNGSLKLNPSMYNDIWLDWLNDTNYRDWCVSRQLWWGHQIPAYYYKQNYIKHWVVASSEDEALKHFRTQYGNSVWVQQDSDVLDTWFSSALLPISSFGWPNQTVDLKKYYPLSIMETGHDILIFWVARMVMLGLELTDKLPFNEVLLHGILCDAQEKKMSKSRGNVIFPENVINGVSLQSLNEQVENNFFTGILNIDELKETVAMNTKNYPNGIANCGVDALRFTLCSHNIKERTVTFDITECEQNKFFLNKIWQASKYLLQMTNDYPIVFPQTLTTIDKWILSRLSFMVDSVNNGFDEKAFYKAVSSIKQFMYYEFCDYYLEGTKLGFKSKEIDVITSHRYTLAKCLEVTLRILAPITPYFSDDLYSKLSKKLSTFVFKTSLLESSYPTNREVEDLRNVELEQDINKVTKLISFLRSLLSNVPKRKDAKGCIVVNTLEDQKLYEENINLISGVSRLLKIEVSQAKNYKGNKNNISSNTDLNCFIDLIIKDQAVLNEVKQKIQTKKVKIENKFKNFVQSNKRKKFSSNKLKEQS